MDLSLVPVNELADEIMNRGKVGIVFIQGLEGEKAYINWIGDYYAALGLCVDMQRFIIKDSQEEFQ